MNNNEQPGTQFHQSGYNHEQMNPYEPELGTPQNHASNDDSVAKTGTTTVGITTDDGVVVGTDRRASLGGRFVSNKNVVKVEQIHPTAVLTLVGSVGGAQSFIRTLRSEASLYEQRRGEAMSISALATLAGNFARGGPFFGIFPILGGVDDDGSHVYSVDSAGGVMKDDYTVTGSGMQLAHGALEGEWSSDLSMSEAETLAARAINAATERDTGSGNGLVIASVTDEDVDISEYDSVNAVLE